MSSICEKCEFRKYCPIIASDFEDDFEDCKFYADNTLEHPITMDNSNYALKGYLNAVSNIFIEAMKTDVIKEHIIRNERYYGIAVAAMYDNRMTQLHMIALNREISRCQNNEREMEDE